METRQLFGKDDEDAPIKHCRYQLGDHAVGIYPQSGTKLNEFPKNDKRFFNPPTDLGLTLKRALF